MAVLQSGYISIIFLKDLQVLHQTHSVLAYKIYQCLSLKTIDILSLQYFDHQFIEGMSIVWAEYPIKRIQIFIDSHSEISNLLPKFFENKETKAFANVCRVVRLETESFLVKKFQHENCVFILITGELLEIGNTERIINNKEIFGFEQFFYRKPWIFDIKAKTTCEIVAIHRDIFDMYLQKNSSLGIKIYKLLTKLFLDQMCH